MPTSPTTSPEHVVREALLDVLHAQWREFGVPFDAPSFKAPLEAIDPEELIWCSLQFFGEEPRLEEAVRRWCVVHRGRVTQQRLNALARGRRDDPDEAARLVAWKSLQDRRRDADGRSIGRLATAPSCLHLRARDVLGTGCAAFLMAALLGSPRGVRCRDVAQMTGYSYRAVADVANAWSEAGIARLERGFCAMADPTPWARILRCEPGGVVLIDWHVVYAASIDLLRTLAKARAAGFDEDHPLVAAAFIEADESLQHVATGVPPERTPAVAAIREAIRTARLAAAKP